MVQSTQAESEGKVKAEIYEEDRGRHDAEEIGTKSKGEVEAKIYAKNICQSPRGWVVR